MKNRRKSYRFLSPEETNEKVLAWQERGDKKALADLVDSMDAWCKNRASYFCKTRGGDIGAALSAAYEGLLAAINRYDVNRGYKLSTYASYAMVTHMNRAMLNDTGAIRLPFAAHTTDPEKARAARKTQSLHTCRATMNHLEEVFSYEDCQATNLANREGVTLAETTLINCLNQLEDRDRLVIEMRFWEEKTLKEVGEVIGVTRERVRQIEVRVVQKLRTIFNEEYRAVVSAAADPNT